MIDILIPVLGRPQNAAPLVENIHAVTTVPFRIHFICSLHDHTQREACLSSGADHVHVTGEGESGDYAKKINWGFECSDGEWVFMGADDITFQPRWDTIALKTAGNHYDVVATNDMANRQVRQGLFGTHNLVRRRYVTDGKVLHEGYDHNYVDRELAGWARKRGVFTFARHSRVLHRHPLWRTAPNDPTYRKALKHARKDRDLFLARAHLWGYHGLTASERKLAA